MTCRYALAIDACAKQRDGTLAAARALLDEMHVTADAEDLAKVCTRV